MTHAPAPEAEVELDPELFSSRVARQFAIRTVGVWHSGVDEDALEIVVSELVTNAVRHGTSPIRLLLRRVPSGVRVEVEDAGDRFQTGGPARASSSRGLRIVASLTRAWGVEPRRQGKMVWAEIAAGDPWAA